MVYIKMSLIKKILPFVLIILTILRCQDSDRINNKVDKKDSKLVEREFGLLDSKNEMLSIELDPTKFKNWNELIDRVETIACNDSMSKMTLITEREKRTIYFHNPCWMKFACIHVKRSNAIIIHNDKVVKKNDNCYPFDSLESVLKKDITNNGINPSFCESPEKLTIFISFEEDSIEKLSHTLENLTSIYEKITNNTDIEIVLVSKDSAPPSPTFEVLE
jgi:hypothetical protein